MGGPKTLKDLAEEYGMNYRTFLNHLKKTMEDFNIHPVENKRRHLTRKEVEEIRNFMGGKDDTKTKTMKELALYYGTTYRSFLRNIQPIRHTLSSVVRGIRILTPKDLKVIYDWMGEVE